MCQSWMPWTVYLVQFQLSNSCAGVGRLNQPNDQHHKEKMFVFAAG